MKNNRRSARGGADAKVRRRRPKTLEEIFEIPCTSNESCRECGRRPAACVCEACADDDDEDHAMLCATCFRLIHPRRADGTEHDHLKSLAVRPVDATTTTGTLEGAGNAGCESGCRLLPGDGLLELTEDDLEAAGFDLSKPTTFREMPKIIVEAGVDPRPLREGQVVVFTLRENRTQQGHPYYKEYVEGWGVVQQRASGVVTKKDGGERVYQIKCFESKVSPDYAEETLVAETEEAIHREDVAEAQKRRSGAYSAIYMGFASLRCSSQESRIDPIALPADDARVVDVLERDIYLPKDLRNLLLARRARYCRAVLCSIELRSAKQSVLERFVTWSKLVAASREHERAQAATLIARAWKKKQRYGMDLGRAGINHLMVRRHGLENRKFKPLLFLTREEKAKCYSTDHRIFFRTRKELEEYTVALRDVGNVVCGKMLDRALANKRYAFTKWRDVWLAIVEKDELVTPHIDAYKLDDEIRRVSPPTPWHPAVGVKLPRLPSLWSKPGAHRRVVENSAKFNSMRTAMQGPTDNSNWVVPGMLLIGPHPSGPVKVIGRREDVAGAGVALLQAGVRVFVDLCPKAESTMHEASLGAPWKRLVDDGRRMGDDDASDVRCAMHSALQIVSEKLSRSIANAASALNRAKNELAACPRYEESDSRYEEAERNHFIALAKERMLMQDANKHRRQLEKLPDSLEVVHYPIAEDDCGGGDESVLLGLCKTIEARMRSGQTVYVYSRRGHGRAGMLGALVLGRLYGITALDAIDRIQVYHDARRVYRLANDESRVISCPQSRRQIATVHRLLVHTDTIYSEHCITGRWQTRFRRKERGQGIPPSRLSPTREPQDKWSPLVVVRTGKKSAKLPPLTHVRDPALL